MDKDNGEEMRDSTSNWYSKTTYRGRVMTSFEDLAAEQGCQRAVPRQISPLPGSEATIDHL